MSTDLAFPAADARTLVRIALDEDLGPRHLDVTTLATIPADQKRTAHVVARAHPGSAQVVREAVGPLGELGEGAALGPADEGLTLGHEGPHRLPEVDEVVRGRGGRVVHRGHCGRGFLRRAGG